MPAEAAALPAAPPSLPVVQAYHPATFRERGVAAPFTTPALLGARLRLTARGQLEIVAANPAGGRGVYVLPWAGVSELCRPTVHDILLGQRIGALPALSPGAVRAVARDVAAEGMAGREATAAAHMAALTDQRDRIVTNFHLLLALIAQVEPAELADLGTERSRSAELELRARRALARIGPKLGRSPVAVATTLEDLAVCFAAIGMPDQTPAPRIPRGIDALARLRVETSAWGAEHRGESATHAETIAALADMTLSCAGRMLADARGITEDMARLMRGRTGASAALNSRLARPDWLLDGWDRLCGIWNYAEGNSARHAALAEIVQLLPVLPRETAEWIGAPVAVDAPWRPREPGRQHEDARIGSLFERIERNEALRAMEV